MPSDDLRTALSKLLVWLIAERTERGIWRDMPNATPGIRRLWMLDAATIGTTAADALRSITVDDIELITRFISERSASDVG